MIVHDRSKEVALRLCRSLELYLDACYSGYTDLALLTWAVHALTLLSRRTDNAYVNAAPLHDVCLRKRLCDAHLLPSGST
jgi:hypothetical protein